MSRGGGSMKSNGMLTIALCMAGSTLLAAQAAPPLPAAPANPPAPSLQAPNDPGYATLIASCKTPPPARGGRGGAAGAAGAPGRGGAAVGRGNQPQGPRDYTVTEI